MRRPIFQSRRTHNYSPVPVAEWAGFYAGIHLGAAWGYFQNNAFNIGPTGTGGGFMGGAQLGYNWQNARFVYGVEADVSLIDIEASTAAIGSFRERWMATVRGRIGYTFENFLAYLTAGIAFTDVNATLTALGSSSTTALGPTVGFGVETMFAPNWTGRVEALYVGVPKHTFLVGGAQVVGGSHNYVVRAGANYLFH